MILLAADRAAVAAEMHRIRGRLLEAGFLRLFQTAGAVRFANVEFADQVCDALRRIKDVEVSGRAD